MSPTVGAIIGQPEASSSMRHRTRSYVAVGRCLIRHGSTTSSPRRRGTIRETATITFFSLVLPERSMRSPRQTIVIVLQRDCQRRSTKSLHDAPDCVAAFCLFSETGMSFERFESVAQGNVLREQIVFGRAQASVLFDEGGNPFIDFCSGGYGHNAADVNTALIHHLSSTRIIQSYDRMTVAKQHFVDEFASRILWPRNLRYRVLFTDPASGTAAETALKLARRHKGRSRIVAFTHASHGLTDGSRAVTSRSGADWAPPTLRGNTTFMPFCGFFGNQVDTILCFRRYLEDAASGLDRPAAVIVESIQVH